MFIASSHLLFKYSHLIHRYSQLIRSLFTAYSHIFAHYSHTIRTLFASKSPKHFPPAAGCRRLQRILPDDSVERCVYCVFTRVPHTLFAVIHTFFAAYAHLLRALFALFAHLRAEMVVLLAHIHTYSHTFTPRRTCEYVINMSLHSPHLAHARS